MTATTDQILQQEQLHYQVLSQRIDTLYTNLNSGLNAEEQRLNLRIDQAKEQLKTWTRGDITFVNNDLHTLFGNGVNNIIKNVVDNAHDTQTKSNQKLDTVLNLVQAEIRKTQDTITAVIDSKSDLSYDHVEAVTGRLTQLITDETNKEIHAVEGQARTINSLVQSVQDNLNGGITAKLNSINSKISASTSQLNAAIDSKIDHTNAILSGVTASVIKAVNDLPANVNNSVVSAVGGLNLSGLGGSEPAWMTAFMEALYTGQAAPNPLDIGGNFLTDITNQINTQIQKVAQIVNNVSSGAYSTYDQFTAAFKSIGVDSGFISQVLQLFALIPTITSIASQTAEPFKIRLDQLAREKFNLTQVDTGTILSLANRGYIDSAKATNDMKALGYNDTDASNIVKLGKGIFDIQQAIRLYFLGNYDNTDLNKVMTQHGFTFNEVPLFLELYRNRPGINDLIQFAVKEVFSPETANKFGQFQEFPTEFAKQAKKLGMAEQDAKNYWAAHWDLPSPMMGYEMLHRGIINTEDLKALLKALDIMPYWRDKLIQLSYRVITRVDARRLHAFNLVSDSQLSTIYQKEGYSPSDAQMLVGLANKIEDEQENPKKKKLKDLTYTVLINAYGDGLLSRNDATIQIMALGYDQNEVNLLLRIEDYNNNKAKSKTKKDEHDAKLANLATKSYLNRAISRDSLLQYLDKAGFSPTDAQSELNLIDAEYEISFKAQIAKDIERQYFEGLYNDNDVLISLQSLNFLPSEANKILNELQILKTFRTKKPSISQLTNLFKKGYYTQTEYEDLLRNEGFAEEFIPAMLQLAGVDEEE